MVVWRGEYLPFGEVFSEDTDPDGDGVEVQQPFRFPGQYEDAETGLYYNYFRDYDPQIGRYVEADPIGLAGGVNLFSYAVASPVNQIDFMGLVSGGGGFYVLGGAETYLSIYSCCEGKNKYRVKVWTICGGVGAGLKASIPISVTLHEWPKKSDCPPLSKYYGKHETTFFVRSVNVQAGSEGPDAGLSVGLFGAGTVWVFCSDTVLTKDKIGCCE